MKFALCTAFAVCLVFSVAARAAEYVIVISCDGLRPDAVEKLGEKNAPTFHRLMKEGAYTHNARTDATFTVTLPNHTSMITGRGVEGPAGHGWKDNGTPKLGEFLHKRKQSYIAGMFDVAHDHGLRTAVYASKKKFVLYDISYDKRFGGPDMVGEDNGRDKIGRYVFEEEAGIMLGRYITEIEKNPFHLTMIHMRDTDSAGHWKGWDLTEDSHYLAALRREDKFIGRLLQVIQASYKMRGKTALIVTTDHGGRMQTKTHTNAKHPNNYTIPLYVWGAGVSEGVDLYTINPDSRADPGEVNPAYGDGLPPVRNGDAGNLALHLLGLPPIPNSFINAKQDLKVQGSAPAKADPDPEPPASE